MTLEELIAAATPRPWRLGSWKDNVFGTGPNDEWIEICRVKRDDYLVELSHDHFDARLIAIAPDLAAALIKAREALEPFALCSLDGVVKPENTEPSGHVHLVMAAKAFHEAREALAAIDALTKAS